MTRWVDGLEHAKPRDVLPGGRRRYYRQGSGRRVHGRRGVPPGAPSGSGRTSSRDVTRSTWRRVVLGIAAAEPGRDRAQHAADARGRGGRGRDGPRCGRGRIVALRVEQRRQHVRGDRRRCRGALVGAGIRPAGPWADRAMLDRAVEAGCARRRLHRRHARRRDAKREQRRERSGA